MGEKRGREKKETSAARAERDVQGERDERWRLGFCWKPQHYVGCHWAHFFTYTGTRSEPSLTLSQGRTPQTLQIMFQHCRDVGFNKSFFCRDPTDTLDYLLTTFGTDLMFFQPPTQRNHRGQCFLNKITAWMSHICPNLAKRDDSVPVRINNPKPTWTSSTHSSCMRTKKWWWKEKIGMNFSTKIIPVVKINITLANAIVKGELRSI